MSRPLTVLLCAALSLPTAAHAAPAVEEVGQALDCPHNAEGVAPRIKAILGPHFGVADDAATLADSFRELELLTLQAGHCSAAARSTERDSAGRERNIMEWHSMNQWLGRLVAAVGLNVRGDLSRPWRDEYALFAEIYEFEP